MNFQKFSAPDGKGFHWVNLDQVVAAELSDKEETVILHSAVHSIPVDLKQYEVALEKKQQRGHELPSVLSRLVTAIERLSMRIPSALRLKM